MEDCENIRLNEEDISNVASILGGEDYAICEKTQSIGYDGIIYLSDILKAADFIRSKIEVETPIKQSH